ncbi:MAG: ATP-binding protein [Pseudomonadota bacterium]
MRHPTLLNPGIWGVALAFAIVMVLAGLAGFFALPRIEAAYRDRAQNESAVTLRLVASALNNAVRRVDPLPALISEQPPLLDVLQDPGNQGLVPYVNQKLRLAARALDVTDIHLIDPAGRVIAASNYREDTSRLGQSEHHRPYFQRAMTGATARFHALDSRTGERAFYVAAPVLDGIRVAGVLTVRATVDALEQEWVGHESEILIADPNGLVFLSSRPDFQNRLLAPLPPAVRDRIISSQQFPVDRLDRLDSTRRVVARERVELGIEIDGRSTRYLSDSVSLELPGWHAIVLAPLEPIRRQALLAASAFGLALTVLALLSLVFYQRWARVTERGRVEEAYRLTLEGRVQARTAELDATNAELLGEVEERRATEAELRRTQQELVQTGKLAALGQMSAALSHEINQPLAAVKSYAENAAQYLDRDRVPEARGNIQRISEMADRMAKISGHLRNFARRPADTLKPVPVGPMIEAVVGLVAPQARAAGAEIRFALPPGELFVIGGPTRLQQVLVNVVTNALDAMGEAQEREVCIDVQPAATEVVIEVRDTGPGFPPGVVEHMFDPFFTTKTVGKGMGLGLSISHNIIKDFGGKITAENHPGGGAVFRVSLRRTDPVQETPRTLVAE